MSKPSSSPDSAWILLDVIAVDQTRRVQCQCKRCGHSIYAAIHMVQLPTGEVQCWGQDCYEREAGLAGLLGMKPVYSGFGGRKLTDEEREWLSNNRDRLIAEFKAKHEELLRRQEEARRAEEARQAQAEALRKAEIQRQEEVQRRVGEEARRFRASFSAPRPAPALPIDDESEEPVRSVYDLPPRKCVFCGNITSEWWTNVGADGCKCKACLRAGKS
jgi:hypothetical protein